MPLVEVIVGEDTSQETATAAYNFAQAIKKQPIVCGEVPGFVVNRILMATMGEIWRAQEEHGLSLKAIDEAIAGAQLAPMGPFFLTDLLGLDTVLHVAEHLNDVLRRAASTSTRACRAWSAKASSAPRPAARASSRTASRTSPATASPTPRSWWRCSPAGR